jgi:hypothetical protein
MLFANDSTSSVFIELSIQGRQRRSIRELVSQLRRADPQQRRTIDGSACSITRCCVMTKSSRTGAARMFGAMQNLAVTGLSLTLTEFGVQTKSNVAHIAEVLAGDACDSCSARPM